MRSDLPVTKLAENVYLLNEFDGTNCYLVVGEKRALLIDCGTGFCDLRGAAEKMIEGCDYLNGAEVGNTVAVIGGGLTGCEIAYELALQGKNPIIVEMKDDLISQTGVCLANSSYLREWFALHKTPVYLETTLKEVKDGSIVCTGKDGKDIDIDCDSVISCAGYIPAPLAEKSGNVHLVGDCLEVGNLRSVVWRAYDVAMKI